MEFKTQEELQQFVEQFVLKVTEKSSDPKSWSKSKTEWEISYYGVNEANHDHLTCYLCGNPLHHVLGLYNAHTTRNLYPVCPFCIDKFEQPKLKEEVDLLMSIYAFNLIARNASDRELIYRDFHFEPELIDYLSKLGCFDRNRWDYVFMKSLVNSSWKHPSQKQVAHYSRIVN